MHSTLTKPAVPARICAALAELNAIARERHDPLAADLARRARQGVMDSFARQAADRLKREDVRL